MGPSNCGTISISHVLMQEPPVNLVLYEDTLLQDTGICAFLLLGMITSSLLESSTLVSSL